MADSYSNENPTLINFPKIGETSLGFLSIAEELKLSFPIKRVFWAYYTPDSVIRGRHAHYETEMILVAVAGVIEVTTQMPGQDEQYYILDSPSKGLYLPKLCWHTMKYSHNSVQLCLASTEYFEEDYIRDYSVFKAINQ